MITLSRFKAETYKPFSCNVPSLRAGLFPDTDDYEEETFEEHTAHIFANDIKKFISAKQSTADYKDFVNYIFRYTLDIGRDDALWRLLAYVEEETDFYTAPASTRFHSSEEHGLVRHSLLVAANGLHLAPVMLSGNVDMFYLMISCLFHDLCKTNMYEIKLRNAKNEETGIWEKVPFYKVRDDYISYGHGIESMLRINNYIAMPDGWNHAVRWHMGAFDISPLDKIALDKVFSTYKEVLFLQTADMQAGLVEDI